MYAWIICVLSALCVVPPGSPTHSFDGKSFICDRYYIMFMVLHVFTCTYNVIINVKTYTFMYFHIYIYENNISVIHAILKSKPNFL